MAEEIILPKGAKLIAENTNNNNIVLPKGAKLITNTPKEDTTEFTVPTGNKTDGIPTVEVVKTKGNEIPFTKNIPDSQKVNFFGFDFILPKGEDKPESPWNGGLLKSNAKLSVSSLNAPMPLEQTAKDLEYLKQSNPDQITEFFKNKKQQLNDFKNNQLQIIKSQVVPSDLGNAKLEEIKLNDEVQETQAELDATAKNIAFQNAPFMYKQYQEYEKAPDNVILKSAQLVGNDVQNIMDEKQKSQFQAKADIPLDSGIGYSKQYKDNLTYLGLQSEINGVYKSIEENNNSLKETYSKIKILSDELEQDPTNKSLVQQINNLVDTEVRPIQFEMQKKKDFADRLTRLTDTLPTVKEQIEYQKQVDDSYKKYQESLGTDNPDLLGIVEYGSKSFLNRLSNTLKQSAVLGNEISKKLGSKSEEETTIQSANLNTNDNTKFTLPTRLKTESVIKRDKEGNIDGVNWDIALPMTLQTTAETLTMGAIGSIPATYGTLGQIGGLYLGSSAVFGGDLMEAELKKGLSYKEALAVTGLRLGVEAATEMVNPLEFIPFNGVIKKSGSTLSKSAFIDFVGNNYQTLFSKWKAMGLDISKTLLYGAKSVGMESFEEVLSDLGNYGIDKAVINTITPDYRQDNEFTVQNEINTALTTALTMLPMGAYQGVMERQAEKQAPVIRWSASQMPETFLENLKTNFDKGLITKEFYETGKKEVETINNLYKGNKTKIDNVEEEQRPTYLNTLYEQKVASEKLLNNTDPEKIEELTKELEKITKQVQVFDKEATININLTPEDKVKKTEERYIENIKDFTSKEDLKSATIEDINSGIQILQDVINNPYSENVKIEAEKQLQKLNTQLETLNTKQEETKVEITPVQEFENKISTASQEELEKLRIEIQDNKELSKEGKQLRKKILERENELLDKEKNVTFTDGVNSVTFKKGEQVTLDEGNSYWNVEGLTEDGRLKLSRKFEKTTESITVSDVNDVKPYSFNEKEKKSKDGLEEPQGIEPIKPSDTENLISQEELFDTFGKPTSKEPPQDTKVKKAEIEKLEKEKQKILKPLIEEKEQIEKEIEEIEKDSKSSKTNSQEIESLKEKIKDLRNTDGTIPENKLNEFRSLRKQIQFLESDILHNINKAINEFISDNNLTEKDKKLIYALAEIRDNFQEVIDEFNEKRNSNYTLSEIMTFFGSSFNLQESIETETETDNKKAHEYENKLLEGNGFKANEDYTADELNDFVQKHGSKQVKFIWNLIKAVAQKLGVTTRFMLQGNSKIPVGAAGHYLNGKIENRASLFSHPESAARIIVHELVHGVTTYILKAVEQNNTKILSKLTTRQLKAVEKLNALFDELKKDKEFDDTYGTKNTHELLAELTNENFVDKLKSKNVFEKILEAIFEIFNIPFNAYNESVKILEDLISNPLEDNRYEGSLGEGYSLYSKSESTKLQQLKQKLAEVNKKIDEVTKRFNAQIAQKQAELKAVEEQPKSNQSEIEAKKADIERRKQALRDLMKATGDDIFMLGVEDGTFMGESLLNMNENGDVVLTRYADSEEGLTKGKGKTKNLKDIAGQFGGEQIATSGIEGGAASFTNRVVGEYHIPLQELIDLIKSEDVVFAGLGNKEFVLSPHIADKYLTKINGKQINAKYDAELKSLENVETEEHSKQEVSEEKPTTTEPVISGESKEFKKEVEKTIEKYEESTNQFKSGNNKSSNWLAVVSKLYNQFKKEGLNDYRISVVNANTIDFEDLSENTQEYWRKQSVIKSVPINELIAKDKGKYLVLSDKDGNTLYFNEAGEIVTKEIGKPVISNFSDGTLINDKKSFNEITEARKNNSTHLIDRIVYTPSKLTKKVKTLAKDILGDNSLQIIRQSDNRAYVKIGDELQPATTRPLTSNEIETIIAISKNLGSSGLIKDVQSVEEKNESQRFQKAQYLTNLIFSGTGKGKINFELKVGKGENNTIVTIKQADGTWKTPTDTELREFLSKQWININYHLLESSVNFTTYKMDGRKVVEDVVHKTYTDFLREVVKVPSTEIGDTNEHYTIEVGAVDDSIKAKVIEAETEQPKIEVVEPVKEEAIPLDNTPVQETPSKKIVKKEFKKKSDTKDNPLSGDLFRNRRLNNKVTEQQKQEAISWFKSHPISEFIKLNHFQNVINSDAFASWNKAGITLWNESNFSDLYHEAWHEFSQLYLTKAQKQALYNEVRSKNFDFINSKGIKVNSLTASDFDIEEHVAEDFYKYVLSSKEGKPLILNNQPKRNSIFRKVYNFLKEFITGNTDIQTYYERLYTGNINNYKRDLNNAFFGSLNVGLKINVNGETKTLTNEETKQLYRGLDSLISNLFEEINQPIATLFAKNNVLSVVYDKVFDKFNEEYENYVDKYNNTTDELEQEALQQVITNLEYTLSNWNNVLAHHKRFSPYFNLSKDVVQFDDENNLIDNEVDEDELTRSSEIDKNNNVSSKEVAANETIYLIATLPRYENGRLAVNPFFPFVNDIVDFNNTWNQLTNTTNNTLDYEQILNKIDKLGDKNHSFKDLLQRIPTKEDILTDAQSRLKSAFINDISKPRIEEQELVLSLDEKGNLNGFYKAAAATDIDTIKKDWFENFNKIEGEYKTENEDSGVISLNTQKLLDDFKSSVMITKSDLQKADKNEIYAKRVEFLNNLGITFSDETILDPQFKDLILSENNPVTGIYLQLKKRLNADEVIINPFKDVAKYQRLLSEAELKHSSTLSTQSVKNPEGNNVWLIRQWNYTSKIYNALNDTEKYPTYQDFQNTPWLKALDENSNPYVKGAFLNSIFDLTPNSPTYGKRRTKNGIPVKLTLESYAGIKIDAGKGVKNEGTNTTSLTAFEKLVQNINTMLLYGVQEHLRYGDKSSSFATRISHVYDPVSKQLEDRSILVPREEFYDYQNKQSVVLPITAFQFLLGDLKAELIPMKRNFQTGLGNNIKNYNKNIKGLGVFEGILSKETFEKLKTQIIENDDVVETKTPGDTETQDISDVLKSLSKDIRTDIENYIEEKSKDLQKELGIKDLKSKELNNILVDRVFYVHSNKTIKNVIPSQIMYAYVVNSLLYNIEHTKIVTQDPRFYSAKGDKKNPFKRFSAWSATGNLFVVDNQTNEYIASKKEAIKEAVAKKLNTTIAPSLTTGEINSVVFKDVVRETKYFKLYTDLLAKTGQFSEEVLKSWYKAYNNITEPDGQGYVTLDELRKSKLRSGSSHWTKAHEEAYQAEADFVSGKSPIGMTSEQIALFTPQKWQYAGNTTYSNIESNQQITAPVFYKFSVVPLIPSAIKGTPFEEIHDNLVKQNVGLALFESGSKMSAITNSEGNFNPFYENQQERIPYTGNYTINTINYEHLKEQVNIEPELKEKVTFSTQMRKLLFLNTFNGGVPIDAPKDMTLEQWDALSDADKKKNSSFYKLEQKFNKVIDNLVNLERNKVLEQLGATKKLIGGYKLDNAKVAKFFQEEFEKRGLPDEIIDYFQIDQNGNFTYPLDASKSRDKIEQIVYSIANRRLVQQKINGDALIQVAATGFEMMKGFESYQEDADLPFYEPGEDGVTKAQKVKIAFSSKWKPLLNLDYKGEKIETIDRLNQAIKDESWMSKNKDFVTLTAVRIPVQGLNSMEFMEVFHFLPESMGNVIVVSPALVAKSGGDFDIDKLTTFFPNIFHNKYTGQVKLYNSKDLKIKDSNLSKEIKDIVKPSKEKLKALTKIRQELSSEMSAYKSQKEGIKATKDEIKLSLRKLDVEIALYNEQLDLLEEVEFALTNPDDITTISNLVAETLGENALVEATQSVIEQTKNTIKTKINEGITNQQFLLKAINTSLKELSEDLNYTRLEINNINKAINPVKEFLGKMQELVYESSAKKAYENEVISIIREVLSHPDNFAQLVRPNDTDLLNNEEYGSTWFKANSKEKKDKTWTGVVDFSEIKKQFLSNLVGKASLGIAAVNNTFFALSQRAGLYLNDNYTTFQGAKQKPVLNKTRINLPHNTVNIGGKELPSLSNKFAKDQNYQISDVISQFINGFVDVANDDWVFFINAVKEYTPTMLFLNQLGVDAKTNIAFFNQPILKEYLASVQKKKNLFNRLRNPELYTFAANRSVEEILLEAENIKDEKLQQLIDKLRVKKADPIGFTFFEYQAILNYLQDKAEQNKDVFSLENLSKSVYNNTPLTTEENLMILAHYLELKKMGDTVTTLQRGLNADTKKVGSSYAVQERQSLIEQAKKSKLFPEDIVSKMRNSSAISAFTNEETGFDKFSKDLFEDLFELTGNDVINSTLKELTSKDPDLKFEYKSSESSKLISTFKNDFISYIYQKNVYEGNTLVSKLIEPLFNPKSSLVKELQQLKNTYPELAREFPILDILTPDILRVNGKEIKSNLKFKHNLSNRDEINNAVQNIRQLLSFNNPSYSKENQLEIQDFTKKLVKFAIIQSGLNNSVFNIMSMIPNEEYTKDLTKAVKESIDVFKNKPLDAKKAIEKFYNQSFKEQNPSFFTKLTDEEGYVKGNKNPERGKIFTNKGLETETSELVKQNKKQQFIDSIPSLTSTYDTNVAAAIKDNKDTLLIIEDNTLKSKTNPLEKDKAFIGTIFTKNDSKQPLSDEDFIKNQELIDRAIELIIDKAYDKVNLKGIKFPEQGVGQDLLTSSPETFNYLSKRLKDSFGYNNLNFTENSTQEKILEIETTQETEQPIQNKERILQKQNVFTVKPIQTADKKAIIKASVANKYVGFGEGIANSSTELYRKQAGEFANVGNYNPNDVVFVSIGGKRGDATVRKEQQDKTIKEALKAIEAGATLITDNKSYVESSDYNEGEKRLAKNLEAKGYVYSEQTVDGQVLGIWNKNQPTEIKPKIEVVNRYSVEDVKNSPNKLYIFGDNTQRQGKGGQAIIRGNRNARGIATKFLPSTSEDAYFNDKTFSENKSDIDSDIEDIQIYLENHPNTTVVFPKDGLGTGLAKLKEKAPQTYQYLKEQLLEKFGFNNDTGELTQEQPIIEETKEELPGLDNLPDPQCK